MAEAPSVARRVREDRIAYASHIAWMAGPTEGRRRTRMTPRLAAMRLNEYERAQALLEAEEAVDDPLRMAPVLLAGKAVAGEVIRVDEERREVVNSRRCLRPGVTLRTLERCAIPVGTELLVDPGTGRTRVDRRGCLAGGRRRRRYADPADEPLAGRRIPAPGTARVLLGIQHRHSIRSAPAAGGTLDASLERAGRAGNRSRAGAEAA